MCCGLENNTKILAVRIESCHIVAERFVFAPMPLILGRVFQQIAVQLPNVILGQVDDLPVGEDGFHGLSVSSHFLFVSRSQMP